MNSKHLVTEDTREKAVEEAEENGRDLDAIRDMYITPEEAIGRVFKEELHWGHTFAEAVAFDDDEEVLVLEELFTGEEYRVGLDEIVRIPFIGADFSVSWIEAKTGEECQTEPDKTLKVPYLGVEVSISWGASKTGEKWERVSDYSTASDWRRPRVPKEEDYEQTRVVKKTYEHGADRFASWSIRVGRQAGEPGIVVDDEDLRNPELLQRVLDSIELPDSFDLGGLTIGTVYTEEHLVETEDGHNKEHEIVWWSVDSQFEPSSGRRVSPAKELDRAAGGA